MGNGASQADVPARLTREAACKLIRPCEWDPAFDEYFESSPGVVSATTTVDVEFAREKYGVRDRGGDDETTVLRGITHADLRALGSERRVDDVSLVALEAAIALISCGPRAFALRAISAGLRASAATAERAAARTNHTTDASLGFLGRLEDDALPLLPASGLPVYSRPVPGRSMTVSVGVGSSRRRVLAVGNASIAVNLPYRLPPWIWMRHYLHRILSALHHSVDFDRPLTRVATAVCFRHLAIEEVSPENATSPVVRRIILFLRAAVDPSVRLRRRLARRLPLVLALNRATDDRDDRASMPRGSHHRHAGRAPSSPLAERLLDLATRQTAAPGARDGVLFRLVVSFL